MFPDGVKAIRLNPQALTPVCSPRLLEGSCVDNADQLANFDLLYSSSDAQPIRAPELDLAQGAIGRQAIERANRIPIIGERVVRVARWRAEERNCGA